MIPRLDSARLMIKLGFPFDDRAPLNSLWAVFFSTYDNSRGAAYNFSSCLKLRDYYVIVHALMLSFIFWCC
jgi:hypothetical protein